MDIEALREMLDDTHKEYEEAKAHVYRAEGVIKLLMHQISLEEAKVVEAVKGDTPAPTTE